MYLKDLQQYIKKHNYHSELIYENSQPKQLNILHNNTNVATIDMQKPSHLEINNYVTWSVANKLIKFSNTDIAERINNQAIDIILPTNDYQVLSTMNLKFTDINKNQQPLALNKDEQFTLSHIKRQIDRIRKDRNL